MYRLTYFKTKGRAEPIRLLLAYGRQEFEDNFIGRDKWPQIKPTMPFGKIPVLEADGQVLHQSSAICRFLAKKYGLAGSSVEESLKIDMMADTFEDWTAEMRKNLNKGDEAKAAAKKIFLSQTSPFYAPRFEKVVKANGGYLVNGKLSWADIRFATIEFFTTALGVDVLAQYPNLKSLQRKMFQEPNIKAWLSRREPI